MMSESKKIIQELQSLRNDEKKEILQRFFKTGKGEYGEGDLFLGITVPVIRKIVMQNKGLILKDVQELIKNKHHEIRLTGFLILVEKYSDLKKQERLAKDKKSKKIINLELKEMVNFYLDNLEYANNWDLIDLSCYKLLGDYVYEHKEERKILLNLIQSQNMWRRRAGIVSTMALIRHNDHDLTFAISAKLLEDREDLMHKAVGWMLREAGKRDEQRLKVFLNEHKAQMPRTTLRYAIERFEEGERLKFLKK